MNVHEFLDSLVENYDVEAEGYSFEELRKYVLGLETELDKWKVEAKNLTKDGETLLNIIADKNHNASIMRNEIADLKKKIKELSR